MNDINEYGIKSKQIKQEMETKFDDGNELTLKRAIDEVAGQIDCDEQLKRCKFEFDDANDDSRLGLCHGVVNDDDAITKQPSTSNSVTVSCDARVKDGTILTNFCEKTTITRSTNLRHVLVFKGSEMECFIDLVRRNEVLWDGSFDEYHTRTNKKKQAWECIAAKMSNDLKQVDEETCRKIWLQLRRSYANEKRQQKMNAASRTTRNCKYRRYFDKMKFLDGVMDEECSRENFFISEPEGGKSCSNSPAPEPRATKKDMVEVVRKTENIRKEVPVENDITTTKVIDTLALLAHQIHGQGTEQVVETAQPIQTTQQKLDNTATAIPASEQQFYQQLQTCFFMLSPEKQAILQRDIMKFAFRRTNQLMDDSSF